MFAHPKANDKSYARQQTEMLKILKFRISLCFSEYLNEFKKCESLYYLMLTSSITRQLLFFFFYF